MFTDMNLKNKKRVVTPYIKNSNRWLNEFNFLLLKKIKTI